MKIDFDPEAGHIVAKIGTTSVLVRDITETAPYAVARWLYAHFDGDPEGFVIDGPHGTFRMSAEKIEPDRIPYA